VKVRNKEELLMSPQLVIDSRIVKESFLTKLTTNQGKKSIPNTISMMINYVSRFFSMEKGFIKPHSSKNLSKEEQLCYILQLFFLATCL